jgi:7-cyano-7-deazaguanine reductase
MPPPASTSRTSDEAASNEAASDASAPDAPSLDDAHAATLARLQDEAARHTRRALAHMQQYGVEPEGKVRLFLPPDERQAEIDRLPYAHDVRQTVVYETEPGEFTALCPFSGLPDFGTVRVEYVPGDWILELKSLKYYFLSWREIGAAQEDITALVFQDLMAHLHNPAYLTVTTTYNVRGGINTTCTADSRTQA